MGEGTKFSKSLRNLAALGTPRLTFRVPTEGVGTNSITGFQLQKSKWP